MGDNSACGLDSKTRALLLTIRQALIMVLGAIEDYLGMPRSIVPKRKKHKLIEIPE